MDDARQEAVANVEGLEHTLALRREEETAAIAAFDQASSRLGEANTLRLAAEQQLSRARIELAKAFGMNTFLDELFEELREGLDGRTA